MENNDPQKLGRIKVYVQAAYGTSSIAELPWAYPKFAKPGDFYVPEIGEAVYVERTAGGHCIEQCDKPGGEYIKITSAAGATILMDSSGNIKINGKIIYLN